MNKVMDSELIKKLKSGDETKGTFKNSGHLSVFKHFVPTRLAFLQLIGGQAKGR